MNILAFDTSSSACSVALQSNSNVHLRHEVAPQQQAKLILPMIKQVLEEAKLQMSELDAIAYGCGPGSFTGIRIASSVVQGLGFVKKMPILRISSMAILAQTAFEEHGYTHALICLDARMRQLYCAAYQVNTAGLVELLTPEELLYPHEVQVPEAFLTAKWSGIGEGWTVYEAELREYLPGFPTNIFFQQPHAKALLTLAKAQMEAHGFAAQYDATPSYIR